MRLLAAGLAMCGLRLGIGSVFYARNRPALDIYLHGARLIAIVVTVCGLASWGLAAVSAGMSAVEFAISIAGQFLACELVEATLANLARAAAHAVRLTLLCMLATLAGRSIAKMAGPAARSGPGWLPILPAALHSIHGWKDLECQRGD